MNLKNLKAADDGQLTKGYIQLRSQKKALEAKHNAEIEKYDRAMEAISAILMERFKQRGSRSSVTDYGTPYITERTKSEIVDTEAFYDFILTHGTPEMLQSRLNVSAIEDWNANNPNEPVPGVQLLKVDGLGVRAPSKKG